VVISDENELDAKAGWDDSWLERLLPVSMFANVGNDDEDNHPWRKETPDDTRLEVTLPIAVAVVQELSPDVVMGPTAMDPADGTDPVPTRLAVATAWSGPALWSSALNDTECVRMAISVSSAFNEDADSAVLIMRGMTFHAEGGACFISSCNEY